MIKVIAVGKLKEKAMVSVLDEYIKRLKPIHEVKIVELNNSKYSDSEVKAIIEDEGQRILKEIDEKDYVVLLDLKGKDITSKELASKIETILNSSKPLIFVIGGSHGVSESVVERSNFMWKLSGLTFPHQLVRILLFEQIYRAFMINKNHPYHK